MYGWACHRHVGCANRRTIETIVLQSTDPLGNITGYSYDALYRLTQRTDDELFDAQSNSLGHPQTSYRYDLVGNLLSLTDPEDNVTSFVYDDLDRLKREQITLDSQLKERVYTYDAAGNVVEYETTAITKTMR